MQVTVFGASGKVGQIVVNECLKRGHSVTAFIHTHSPFDEHPDLTIMRGDIYDQAQVQHAVSGSQVVISTLGSWGTPRKDVLTSAMKQIIPAMQANDIRRIISLTGHDARSEGDTIGFLHKLSHATLSIIAGKVLHDGEQHISLLRQSNLSWTVLRSPVMTTASAEPTAKKPYTLTTTRPLPWVTIPRYAVAIAIVDQIELPPSALADSQSTCPYIVKS